MRFTSVFVAGALAAMASAQSRTASLSPAQQSQMDCIDACEDGDVKCQSYCITVPSPNEKQVNATNECVAACPQGKGTEADTEKYKVCIEGCVADNYWKTVDGTPRETNAASDDDDDSSDDSSKAGGSKATATGAADDSDSTASAAASASDADSTDASETESGSDSDSTATGTASGTAAEATETGNAAPALVGGISILGLAAAVLAL